MNERLKNPYNSDRYLSRQQIIGKMKNFQDLIVILLSFGLLCIMVAQLVGIFVEIAQFTELQKSASQILFLLILVELFQLLVIYLQEHSISVGVAAEVTIVSILREIIVRGVLEISTRQLLATCGLLLILGALLMVCVNKTPHADRIARNTHEESTN